MYIGVHKLTSHHCCEFVLSAANPNPMLTLQYGIRRAHLATSAVATRRSAHAARVSLASVSASHCCYCKGRMICFRRQFCAATSAASPAIPPSATLPAFIPPAGTPTSTAALRSSFLQFFQRKNHLILPSSSLVPQGDDTLLFTNAGMVPLKDMLLGVAPPPAGSGGRLASVQKCVRAGGKHNDLENVGHVS
jgi:hypothetical protein